LHHFKKNHAVFGYIASHCSRPERLTHAGTKNFQRTLMEKLIRINRPLIEIVPGENTTLFTFFLRDYDLA